MKLIKEEKISNGFMKIFRGHHYGVIKGRNVCIVSEYAKSNGAASFILRDPKTNELVFTRQFRIAPAFNGECPHVLDFVAGLIDLNDDAKETAIREAAEEVGVFNISNIEEIVPSFYTAIDRNSGKMSVFYGEADLSDLPDHMGMEEEGEYIEVIKIPLDYAVNNMHLFPTVASIIGLMWLKNKFY